MDSGSRLSSAVRFSRRLLWNRALGEDQRPQPIVVLLGPLGSGKSTALKQIGADLGNGVVHAHIDFSSAEPFTTMKLLAQLAHALSQRWTARPQARFTRLTVGLIAAQARLEWQDHAADVTRLRQLVDEFLSVRRSARLDPMIKLLADTARETKVLSPLLVDTAQFVLPSLIRAISRRPWTKGMQWHTDFPDAEGRAPMDALVELNRRAHDPQDDITGWLLAAFLSDVRDNHARMARPDPGSPCACHNPNGQRHLHNWFLLLDNIDQPAGAQFVRDLQEARRNQAYHQEHDALVVIATSGRWEQHWEWDDWNPPWKSMTDVPEQSRPVQSCRDASYRDWADVPAKRHSPYYPVLLEPLEIVETARILGISPQSAECTLVQRATGGLPQAVQELRPLIGGARLEPGSRDALGAPLQPQQPPSTWRDRLTTALGLDDGHLPGVSVDDFITAGPFATAPWLVHEDATVWLNSPTIARILTELRTALWVRSPSDRGGTTDYAELHPWIAGALRAALLERPAGPGTPSYTAQFRALLADSDTKSDAARIAYCRLALGQVAEVVTLFEKTFDELPLQSWLERLDLVTRAPNDVPVEHNCQSVYQKLVEEDTGERSPIRNILARLIAANWLLADPFVTPARKLQAVVVNAYRLELPQHSRRADVRALYDAADKAESLYNLF